MGRNATQVGTVASAALAHFATMLTIQRKEKKITVEERCSRVGISKPTLTTPPPKIIYSVSVRGADIKGLLLRLQ